MLSLQAKANETLELVGGGITVHIEDSGGVGQYFSNKITPDGRVIANPVVGLRYTDYSDILLYWSGAGFYGVNSIAKPITGGLVSGGLGFEYVNVGLVAGGYVQNNNDFYNIGIQPYSLTDGSNAFVLMAGVEVNFKIPLSDDIFLGINNLLTPVVTNHTLSLGVHL
jgi:hypothetical protein